MSVILLEREKSGAFDVELVILQQGFSLPPELLRVNVVGAISQSIIRRNCRWFIEMLM